VRNLLREPGIRVGEIGHALLDTLLERLVELAQGVLGATDPQ
jgi:hypothetical protein